MPNFSIDITEGMGPSEIKVRPNSMNLTSDPLTGYVKIRTSDGFSQSIPLTQKTGKFTYKYTLEANPATIQIDSFGGSATLNITSIKETYLDDVLLETDENWGYSLSADPGITLDGNTVTVGENVNNYDITSKVKVTQNESGKTIEITIQQLAGEVVGEYEFSASPTSLSFVALGQSKNINVTSMFHYTFNGEWRDDNVPWQVQSITAPFKISGNTVSIGENVNPSVRRGSLVLIQPASRKTITISLSQAAAEITYQYNFNVSPTSLDFAATGETKSVSITSTRDRYVNGKYSSTDNWDYSRSNGNNVSGSGTSITMGENTGDSDRSGSVTFTQNTSGKRVTVNCNQEAASIEVTYTFTISPDSLTFENTGGTQNFTVTSTKTTVINGNSSTTNLDYNISGSVSGFTINKGSSSVTASENSGEAGRSGSFTFTQNESNKTITLNVSQGAASVETTYEFSVTPTTMEFEATGGTQAFTITSTKTVTTNGVPVTTSVGYTSSSDTSGITVSGNNVKVTEIEGEGRTGVITFTQKESGKTCTITIVQGEASIEYIFLIGLSESSLSESVNLSYTADSKASETYNVTIRSKKVINSEETNIGYDTESDSSWIVVTKTGGGSTGSGFSWTIQENTSSSSRSGKIILTQKESGKKVYINISQEAKSVVEGWKYYLFSASKGNATSLPEIDVEKEVGFDGSDADIGDWVFGFAIKTLDGALVIGNDDLDLNGWAELITKSENFSNVMRLNTIKVTGADLESLVRSNTQTELQYYSLTPHLTLSKNTTGQSRKVTVKLSLNENPSLVLTYIFTQESAEAIFTWEDGSTVKNLGIFGNGGSNTKPSYVYNSNYYPKLNIRSILSDGEPFDDPGLVLRSIEVDDPDGITSFGNTKTPTGTISSDKPDIITFSFGFSNFDDMIANGSPGEHTITVYQLDRDENRTGKSITLKYSLTGTYLKYTLSFRRDATAIYEPVHLIPGLSRIVVGIRTDTTYTSSVAKELPNPWSLLDGGFIGDGSKSRNIFSWDWDHIEAIREVENDSTFYFGSGDVGQLMGTSNFSSPQGYGSEQMNISPDNRGVYTPDDQGNEFTITVIKINKSS